GKPMLSGEIIVADPPRRLEMTFLPGWTPNARPSRNVYEIKPAGEAVKLTILHFDIPRENADVRQGWARIAASLKSLLETGEPLNVPMEAA
ncbi:MAG: SRPBCC domain-containing protein, partial [Beijerinckiaceae bacterium]